MKRVSALIRTLPADTRKRLLFLTAVGAISTTAVLIVVTVAARHVASGQSNILLLVTLMIAILAYTVSQSSLMKATAKEVGQSIGQQRSRLFEHIRKADPDMLNATGRQPPYAALVAYRLTELGKTPAAIMVSGRSAPFLSRRRRLVSDLPEPEFIDELKRMGGTPAEVFEHREFLDLVLPVVRADFRLFEAFSRPERQRFDCPLIAAAGEMDEDAPVQEVEAWRDLAGSRFTFRVFPGGHFFIQEHRRELVEMLLNEVR